MGVLHAVCSPALPARSPRAAGIIDDLSEFSGQPKKFTEEKSSKDC